jgi:hypothetical protein
MSDIATPKSSLKKHEWRLFLENLVDPKNVNPWLPDSVRSRTNAWQMRFDVYENSNDPAFKKLNAWSKKSKLRREGEKLKQALLALKELEEHMQKHDITNTEYTRMHEIILGIINIQLTKLEISQLRMLEKTQHISRTNIEGKTLSELKIDLHKERERYRIQINKQPKKYSKTAHESSLINTSSFFKAHESKVPFKRHYITTDKTATALGLVWSSYGFVSQLAKIISDIMAILHGIGTVLSAIPFIGAFFSALPYLVLATKAFTRNSSATKKVTGVALICVVIGGLAVSGLGTIAAAIAVVGIMAVGTFFNHIYPLINYSIEIFNLRRAISAFETSMISLQNGDTLQLSRQDRQLLLLKLEQAYMNKQIDGDELTIVRKLILNKSYSDLKLNSHFLKIFPQGADIDAIFLQEMQQQTTNLKKEIKPVEALAFRKSLFVANSVLSLVGASLLIIPTPITWIIGASILLFTATVSIVLTFGIDKKVAKLFARTPAAHHDKVSPEEAMDKQALVSPQLHQHASINLHPDNKPHVTIPNAPASLTHNHSSTFGEQHTHVEKTDNVTKTNDANPKNAPQGGGYKPKTH